MMHNLTKELRATGGLSISSSTSLHVLQRQIKHWQSNRKSPAHFWACSRSGRPGWDSAACLVIQPRLNLMFPGQLGCVLHLKQQLTTDHFRSLPLTLCSLVKSCSKSMVYLACNWRGVMAKNYKAPVVWGTRGEKNTHSFLQQQCSQQKLNFFTWDISQV